MAEDNTEDAEFAKDFLALRKMLFDDKAEDRVAAIVSAAYVEKYLKDIISPFFPMLAEIPSLRKAMFDDTTGMAGTLGRKLDMARALNAITPGTYGAGILISRIRNKFAHNLEVTSFDHAKVRDLVDNLWKPWQVDIPTKEGNREFGLLWSRSDKFRQVTSSVCATIMHHHIKEYPFSYSDGPSSVATGARPALLDKLNKPPRPPE